MVIQTTSGLYQPPLLLPKPVTPGGVFTPQLRPNRQTLFLTKVNTPTRPVYTYINPPLPTIAGTSVDDFTLKTEKTSAGLNYFPQWTVTRQILGQPPVKPEAVEEPIEPVASTEEETVEEIPVEPEPLLTYSAFAQKALDARNDNSLSRQSKLAKAEQDTLNFITRHLGDKSALLSGLKDLGVEVKRAEDHPWVSQFLKAMGNNNVTVQAAVFTPDTLNYPQQAEDLLDRPGYSSEMGQIEEFVAYEEKSKKEGLVTMFTAAGQDKNLTVLYHEIFHVFQTLNGLDEFPDQPYSDDAYQALYNKASKKGAMRRLYFNTCVQPLLWGLKKIGLLNPDPNGIGEAMRLATQKELDAANFMTKNAKALKIKRSGRGWNNRYASFNRWLQKYTWQWEAKNRFGPLWVF